MRAAGVVLGQGIDGRKNPGRGQTPFAKCIVKRRMTAKGSGRGVPQGGGVATPDPLHVHPVGLKSVNCTRMFKGRVRKKGFTVMTKIYTKKEILETFRVWSKLKFWMRFKRVVRARSNICKTNTFFAKK